MAFGVDPNDIYHNGHWYSRTGVGPIESIDGIASPNRKLATLGDSIINNGFPVYGNSSGFTTFYSKNWIMWMNARMLNSFEIVYNGGVAGQSTAQIKARMTEIPPTGAGWCMINGGVNDANGDIAEATTQANLADVFAYLRNNNIRVIYLCSLPSDAFTVARNKSLYSTVAWAKQKAITDTNLITLDATPVVIDTATGFWLPGYCVETAGTNGLHPSGKGAMVMGDFLASKLTNVIDARNTLTTTPLDLSTGTNFGGIMDNPRMSGVAGTIQDATWATANPGVNLATNWALQRSSGANMAVTLAKVARTDTVPGVWQQYTLSGATVNGEEMYHWQYQPLSTSRFAAGQTIYGEVEMNLVSGGAGLQQVLMTLEIYDGSVVNGGTNTTTTVYSSSGSTAADPQTGFASNKSFVNRTPYSNIPAVIGTDAFVRQRLYITSLSGATIVIQLDRMNCRRKPV